MTIDPQHGPLSSRDRLYLDNAATSWPKPDSVYDAVDHFQRTLGAAAGRGAYRHGQEADRLVTTARQRVAQLLHVPDARYVALAFNGTDALNMAILGSVRPGDHVVTTDVEHNSVLRPLRFLEQTRSVSLTHLPCDRDGVVDPSRLRDALRPNTRLVIASHVSNVSGAIQPIDDLGAICREHAVWFLVDAAQSLGHVPIDLEQSPVDLLASSGHKGLMGPLGTGVLYAAPHIWDALTPLRFGGTGTQSGRDSQPAEPPEKLESGNLNMPGIAGLAAGCRFVQERGVDNLRRHLQDLTTHVLAGLERISTIRCWGPREPHRRCGVVSLTVSGYDPAEVAAILDSSFGIQVRAGLHCAPRMHESWGTLRTGGTVRISPGPFSTMADMDRLLAALAECTS